MGSPAGDRNGHGTPLLQTATPGADGPHSRTFSDCDGTKTMTTAATPEMALSLGAEFDMPSQEDWLTAVAKVLKGADFEKRLVSATLDGVRIAPLSTRADWPGEADPSGFPGLAPFRRGARAARPAHGNPAMPGWDVRQRHDHPEPASANRAILADLERGVTSIQLVLDPGAKPTGRAVHVPHLDALDQVLKGVFLDLAPVALESEDDGLVGAAMMMALWDQRGHAGADVTGALNMDPLGCLARGWPMTGPVPVTLARAAALAGETARHWPHVTGFAVDTRPYHGAGASETQELAAALATGLAYVRAMEAAGLPLETAFRQLLFTITVDADVFLSIAKLRAARTLWARIGEACGLGEGECAMALHAVTADRMISVRDPWVNILRTTVAGFAGAVGGAESLTVLPFTAAAGQPDATARRIARNIQIILMEESGLGRVMDPAGGSWSLERLTDALMTEAWSQFQAIEAEGGMTAALSSGSLAGRIASVQAARDVALATRRQPVTGVSEFPNLAEPDVPLEPVDLTALRQTAETIIAERRADGRAISAQEALSRMDGGDTAGQMALIVRAAKSGVLGEDIALSLLETAGDSVTPLAAPLPFNRLSAPFEVLRTASDRHTAVNGTRPAVLLVPLGRLADSTARLTFARNFYAAGGLDAVDPGPLATPEAAAEAYRTNPAAVVVLCSSAEIYGEIGAAAVAALKAAGAGSIVLTGRPGELPEGAGVSRAIFTGCDALDALREAHGHFAIAQAV